ncbi:hypothetical protein QWZ13_17325 [Reinekea marina]|uniref:hypothetical protein n=1 Tax=Reinekea marina TaxID=1310421 RepID=UPI0025B61444|nr:hypothetical protein [Reinekea marina]MDN3650670.1 hypothetical protein [Reinekea marina]
MNLPHVYLIRCRQTWDGYIHKKSAAEYSIIEPKITVDTLKTKAIVLVKFEHSHGTLP